jgi:hypothetical protein
MPRIEEAAAKAERDIESAVVTMLSLKLRSGTSPLKLRTFLDDCLRKATREHRPAARSEMILLSEAARVVRTWHLETQYLTAAGNPKALPQTGKSGLRELVKRHFPPRLVDLALATLKRNRLIRRRRSGYWIPTSRYSRTPKPTAEVLSHFAEGVSRFAETVRKNTTAKRTGDLLLEKAAQVRALPRTESRAFRQYVQAQGAAFLTAVDDWLESRALNPARKSDDVCNAGVYTFAFVDGEAKRKSPRRLKR